MYILKKILFVSVLMATLLINFTGCQREETKAVDESVVNLKIWVPEEANNGWIDDVCEQFKKDHPEMNIEFTVETCKLDDAKNFIYYGSDDAADVLICDGSNIPDLASGGSISQLGGDQVEEALAGCNEKMVEMVQYDGKIYGIPFSQNSQYLLYDKRVYNEEDVKSLEKLLEKGKIAIPLNNAWYLYPFFAANGCTITEESSEKNDFDVNGEKGIEVTNYLIDLANNPNFDSDRDGLGISMMADGGVSALVGTITEYRDLKNALGDNLGVTTLPTININGEDKQLMSFYNANVVVVNPGSQAPQEAVTFACYLATENVQNMANDDFSLPIVNSNSITDNSDDSFVQLNSSILEKYSIKQPNGTGMYIWWTCGSSYMGSILTGETSKGNASEQLSRLYKALNE